MPTKSKGGSKTRRRQRRHRSRRFTQSGGEREIDFILESKENGRVIDFDDLSVLVPDKKYILRMIVKEGESVIPLCILEFTFNSVGELSILNCLDIKLEPYKIKSYLIINIFLQVLKHSHGIRTVFLMPFSDKDKGFIKLYNFYKNMGFVCIGEFRQLYEFQAMSDEDRLKFISEKKEASDDMLKKLTDKNTLTPGNIGKLIINDCMYMAGSVDDILSITRAKITEWEGKGEAE